MTIWDLLGDRSENYVFSSPAFVCAFIRFVCLCVSEVRCRVFCCVSLWIYFLTYVALTYLFTHLRARVLIDLLMHLLTCLCVRARAFVYVCACAYVLCVCVHACVFVCVCAYECECVRVRMCTMYSTTCILCECQ